MSNPSDVNGDAEATAPAAAAGAGGGGAEGNETCTPPSAAAAAASSNDDALKANNPVDRVKEDAENAKHPTPAAGEDSLAINGNDSAPPAGTTANGTAAALPAEQGSTSNPIALKVENIADEEDADEEDANDPEVPDEEENLFLELEQEKEKEEQEELLHPHAQPKAVEAAPRLLQAALKEGQVRASDSEEESDKEKTASPEKKKEEEEPHYHKRESHLDFLLNKASEYSNFISQDLDDLQASMADAARKNMEKAEKKKRKSGGKAAGSKKQKTSDGALKLQTVQAKDAVERKSDKPIFVQPPNLAEGCELMDYQLEGVRWLASLFENGVSGILADGTYTAFDCTRRCIFLCQATDSPFLFSCLTARRQRWVWARRSSA